MVPAWVLLLPWTSINKVSNLYQINPKLVGAIVMKESSGNACATRYENHYRWLLTPGVYAAKNKITLETETIHQKTSWGLMQVMGGVARELGFDGSFTELCHSDLGLHYGIKKLLQLERKYDKLDDVIASYNAGSPRKDESGRYVNQSYVDGVKKYMLQL